MPVGHHRGNSDKKRQIIRRGVIYSHKQFGENSRRHTVSFIFARDILEVAGLGDFLAMEFTASVWPGGFVVVKAVN